MSVRYTITESPTTISLYRMDGTTVLEHRVMEKTNITVLRNDSVGLLVTQSDNNNYSGFNVPYFDKLTVVALDGTTTTSFTDIDNCIDVVNSVIQLNINATITSGGTVVDVKDVEIVEMCDTHLCTDPVATVIFDGGGSPNVLTLYGATLPGPPTNNMKVIKVDWGDGTVFQYDVGFASTVTHNYSNGAVATTYRVRVILQDKNNGNYFVVLGTITCGSGSASGGNWTDNVWLAQKTTKFLRHFVYKTDGTINSTFDTDLTGAPYTASNYPLDSCCSCNEDIFYQFTVDGVTLQAITSDSISFAAGTYNHISIVMLSGTGSINGVDISAGYSFSYDDFKFPYPTAISLLTNAESTASVNGTYNVTL